MRGGSGWDGRREGRGRWSGCQGTEGVTGMGWVGEGWQAGGEGEMVRVPGDRGGDRDGMGGEGWQEGGGDGQGARGQRG